VTFSFVLDTLFVPLQMSQTPLFIVDKGGVHLEAERCRSCLVRSGNALYMASVDPEIPLTKHPRALVDPQRRLMLFRGGCMAVAHFFL
jgi:hypothetical protein